MFISVEMKMKTNEDQIALEMLRPVLVLANGTNDEADVTIFDRTYHFTNTKGHINVHRSLA